jgi:thiol-disulfide isomerase/thioredoxin
MNRNRFPARLGRLVAAAVLLLSFSPLCHAAGWKAGDAVPNPAAYGVEGNIPDMKGKVVYLDFWASWCGPCKASFPVLSQWNKEFGPKGFLVVGVSVDEKRASMEKFLAKTPVSFTNLWDAQQKLVSAANITNMPTSFLIDRKGVIREVHHGFLPADQPTLSAKIQALLSEK